MFGGLMLCISIVLYRKTATTPNTNESITCHPNFTLSTAVGTVIGFLTGLLGVGGGFLIVPAIALLMRCSFCTAIGTSLAIIAINSLAGFMGHLSTTKLNLPLSAVFLVATLSGAVFGAKFSNKCSIPFLHKAFVILIFLVSLFVIAQQIHFF